MSSVRRTSSRMKKIIIKGTVPQRCNRIKVSGATTKEKGRAKQVLGELDGMSIGKSTQLIMVKLNITATYTGT